METKKKDKITVGSVVRVVKAMRESEKQYIGRLGMVVSVIGDVTLDSFFELTAKRRLKVQIDSDFIWLDEDQVQLVTKEKQKVSEPEATVHKFKVGDTVRVTNNPPANMSRSSDGVLWILQMNRYCGHLYRIKRIPEKGYILNEPSEFLFSEEWLEPEFPAKPKPSPKRTIVIEITDDGANAKYVSGKEVIKTVSIKRHPDDKPDDEVAAMFVMQKLFGKNLRDLENAADKIIRNRKEAIEWIHGAKEALDEAGKRILKLI